MSFQGLIDLRKLTWFSALCESVCDSFSRSLRTALLLICGVTISSSCTTVPIPIVPTTCEDLSTTTDWFELGRVDGIHGETLDKLDSHNKACGRAIEGRYREQYLAGREAGLIEFCTAQVGLTTGKSGRPYENVCPAHLESQFLPAYKVGENIRRLEVENQDLSKRIEIINEILAKATGGDGELQSRVEELRGRRARNENQMNEIEDEFFKTL